MLQKLHKNAKTNYHIREHIKTSDKPLSQLAVELNLNIKTVRKWKNRNSLSDKSSKPVHVRTVLTIDQENLIVYERKAHKKTLFEIWDSLDQIIPNLYTMKIYRVLDRWGLSVLPKELTEADRLVKKFRKYTIGYLHIDVIYTPKFVLPDGTKKRWYIFTCIDRVSKLAFVGLTDSKKQATARKFLMEVIQFYPYKINYILTDNGIEFSYNQLPKIHRPKNKLHPFDQICKKYKIQHRTIRFKHPWTNGMVERFNRKIRTNVIRRYLFQNVKELDEKLISYVNHYNFDLKLQQLQRKSPVEYLMERFTKQVKKRPQRIVN